MNANLRVIGKICYFSVIAIASIHFSHAYMVTVGEHIPATFEKLTAFTADKPFQTRVLPCLFARLLELPLDAAKQNIPWLPLGNGLDLAYLGLITLSIFGLLLVFKELLKHFGLGWLAYPLSFLILYPTWANHIWLNILRYPSDVPSLFFFAIGLLFLLRRKWMWYYVVFPLATLNRETSCFLTVAMLCLFLTTDNWREMATHCVAQFLMWMIIKVGLYLLFMSNSGSTLEWPFLSNLGTFAVLVHGDSVNMFGKLGGNANWLFFAFGGLWSIVPLLWRRLPIKLKRLAWVLLPNAVGFFIVTIIWEVRAYNEMLVLITLFAAVGAARVAVEQKN